VDASFGLVFFGTPHSGGNTGALEELAVQLARTFAKRYYGQRPYDVPQAEFAIHYRGSRAFQVAAGQVQDTDLFLKPDRLTFMALSKVSIIQPKNNLLL